MKKFALIGLLVISVFAISMYIYLGGSNETKYDLSENKFYFQGMHYNGFAESKKPQLLFESARDQALSNEGVFVAVINYPTQKEDSISQVIGLASDNPLAGKIAASDTSFVVGKSFVKATIYSHSLIMPNPVEVRNEATRFAQEKGYSLETWSFELYKGEQFLEVYFPLKE